MRNRRSKVDVFNEAKDRLDKFKALHPEFFAQLSDILEEYNRALEDAEKEVRSKGDSDGPFVVSGQQTNVDIDKLYDWLGHENFLLVGGVIEIKQVLSIDKKRFESYADAGGVPKEVLDVCYEKKPKLRTPKKIEIP